MRREEYTMTCRYSSSLAILALAALTFTAPAALSLFVGCGSNGTAEVSGVVLAPNGELATSAPPSLLQRVAEAIVSRAYAMTGLEAIGAGVEVRLQRLDSDGNVATTLTTQLTGSEGTYAIALASDEEPSSTLIVSVGSGDTRMRAFVSGEQIDISPTSEATVRLVIASDFALANFSPAELRAIADAVELAADEVDAGDSIDIANERVEESADDDPAVTSAIQDAGNTA
jgi:hypothetical protein